MQVADVADMLLLSSAETNIKKFIVNVDRLAHEDEGGDQGLC